jgi:ferredoxin
MKIKVISEKCQGHNRCFALAAALFELDDYGYATATDEGAVPSGSEDKAQLAIDNCPERAIVVVEADD